MKAKTARALCALNVGLLVSGTPLLAEQPSAISKIGNESAQLPATLNSDQKKQIFDEEEFITFWTKEHGVSNPDYPFRLSSLAYAYAKNGQIAQAEKTISKVIESAKTFRTPELIIPSIMSGYALCLAPFDKLKAQKAIALGSEYANKLPIDSDDRMQFFFSLINFYKQTGSPEDANKQIADLDQQLRALENARGLDERGIETTAYMLQRMAGLFTDSNKRKTYDLKKAEAFQLRSIAQFDKLPKAKRIIGHHLLQQWYQGFSMTRKSREQFDIVKSLNDGKIFVKQACHGCGMG